jgi:hypothetical protein
MTITEDSGFDSQFNPQEEEQEPLPKSTQCCEGQLMLDQEDRVVDRVIRVAEPVGVLERECCLLVLNLVSSTLPCIRQPRPRLRFQRGATFNPHSTSSQRVLQALRGLPDSHLTRSERLHRVRRTSDHRHFRE